MVMIVTQENIVDPVGYVNANPSLLNQDKIVISGFDLDMLIEPLQTNEPPVVGQTETKESPHLGRLYLSGVAYGIEVDGRYADVSWYPSPAYVNELIEKMGLRPGEDVLRFVHNNQVNEYNRIPIEPYCKDLADGNFPQTTHSGFFGHDRRSDHAIGVLLAPQVFAKNVMAEANGALGFGRFGRKTALDSVGSHFDSASAGISRYTNKLSVNLTTTDVSSSGEDLYYHHYIQWMLSAGDTEKQRRKAGANIHEVIFSHLVELKPTLDRLKAEVAVAV